MADDGVVIWWSQSPVGTWSPNIVIDPSISAPFSVTVADFDRDGVVHLPAILSPDWVAACERAFCWSLEHPGPLASRFYPDSAGEFRQDLCNPDCMPAYRDLIRDSPLADTVASLWRQPDV